MFEYVYLARPDARISGRSVHESRVEMGRRLAREFPVEADLVMPVPESGTPAAAGYAEESGIPFGQGFVKNAYVGRTFIQPSQTLRQLGIRLKLNALEHMIRGKRIVVVDDSIVRGNTQRAQVRMLREAGALEVHVRISSPPVRWPCFYGIDFATRAELIANGLDVDEIAASVGADSLGYISLDGMVEATGQPADALCTACFTGEYPMALPDESMLGKHLLEVSLQSPSLGHEGAPRPQQPLTPRSPVSDSTAYEAAGVSIEAGERAVQLMGGWVEKARRPEMIGGIGGFAGLFDASALKAMAAPAAGHVRGRGRHQGGDRPGARQARHDRLRPGRHARRRPGRLRRRAAVPHRLHRDRAGHPRADRGDRQGHRRGVRRGGLRPDRRRDGRAPGTARTRRVRRRRLDHRRGRGRRPARPGPGPARRRGGGDAGLGAALQRLLPGPPGAARLGRPGGAGWSLDRHVDELGRTLGEELLEPTRIYAKACLALADATATHAMAHVTGGGLAANLERVLPVELAATLDRSTWTPNPVFDLVRRVGEIPQPDLEQTLNCGVGMVALVAPDDADRALAVLAGHGVQAWIAGEVTAAGDRRPRAGLAGGTAPRLVSLVPKWVAVCGNSHPAGSVVLTKETNRSGLARR